jgi:CRISPR-associated endoribonuclease Cas6
MELLSTIVFLKSRHNVSSLPYTGRSVHGWFLREVRRKNPKMAADLHEENQLGVKKENIRPFTLSTLYKGPDPLIQLSQGNWCWLRITSLDKDLSNLLVESVLPDLIKTARIGQAEFDIQPWKFYSNPDPWTVISSYTALMRKGQNTKVSRLDFEFISSTSFKQAGGPNEPDKDVPLPNPDRVFGSYLKYWSFYAGTSVPFRMLEFIQKYVVVNELEIKSERVQFSQKEPNRASTGFTGRVRFAILKREENDQDWPDWDHYANIVRSLAYYAFFSGTGQNTTFGMGQTQLIN